MTITWKTEKWAVAKLKDYAKNPRRFTAKGMEDLKASIERMGYVHPIAINTDGTILSGHARRQVLKELKIKEVDVRVPSRTLTDKEAEECLIRSNRNEAGTWDFDILANQFDAGELIEWGFEPEEFGIETAPEAEVSGEGDPEKDGGIQCFTCPACQHEFTVVRESK